MNKTLVCRVLLPRKDREHPSVSTGYALKKGVVMLSRHALQHEQRNRDKPVILLWDNRPNHPDDVFDSEVEEEFYTEDSSYDLALVTCKTPGNTPENFSYLGRTDFPAGAQWESFGYPKVEQQDCESDYAPTSVGGRLCSPNISGLIELDSNTKVSPPSNWAGISGSPIFMGAFLLGCISDTNDYHEKRLKGVSLPFVLARCAVFRKLLNMDTPKEDVYLPLALPLLKKIEVLQLFRSLGEITAHSPEDIYSELLSLPVIKFLACIVDLQDQARAGNDNETVVTLSNLAFILMPHYLDASVIANLHDQLDNEVVSLPYSHLACAEMAMAQLEQRVIAIDTYSKDVFLAKFSLPYPPESGKDIKDSLKDLSADLSNRFAGDTQSLLSLSIQTKKIVEDFGTAHLSRRLTANEEVPYAQLALKRHVSKKKPRYYLLCDNEKLGGDENAAFYYKEFKKIYPQCVVLSPSTDIETMFQETEEYSDLLHALSPYLDNQTEQPV